MLDAKLLQGTAELRQNRSGHRSARFRREEIVAAPIGIERAKQTMSRHHVTHPAQARRSTLLIDQEHRVDGARRIFHRHNQVMLARVTGQPGMRRGILMQHHSHHRTPRPLLAMR